MQRFHNPFVSRSQEYFGSASWLSVQLGGTGVANAAGWYNGRCLAHGDQDPSLSLRDGPRGLVVHCFAGCKPAEIKAALRAWKAADAFANPLPAPTVEVEQSKADILQSAANIWHTSGPNSDPPLPRYMRERRRITIELPPTLRCNRSLYHKESGGARSPGMVALVTNTKGEGVAIHRTWIDPVTADKAKLVPARKSLCAVSRHSVHLGEPDGVLAVCEGIETGLAYQQLHNGIPVWAALSAPNIANLVVPDQVKEVIIACDNDKTCIDAANQLARRLRPRVSVSLHLPPLDFPHADFNDVLMQAVHV